MIEKEKLPEWIDRYNNNDLHGKELKEFVELLKNNPELRLDVKLDKELNEILAETDIIELRRKIIKNKIPKETNSPGLSLFLLAASITILIGLAIFVIRWMKKADNEILKTEYEFKLADTSILKKKQFTADEQVALDKATIDSIISRKKRGEIKTNDEKLLTNNYTQYLPYESMVGEISRANYFKLFKPSFTDTFRKGSVVTFIWETTSSNTVTITITNNKGQPVFESQSINRKNFHFNTSKLSGGLYYFKFINNDEIIYFGKFTLQ